MGAPVTPVSDREEPEVGGATLQRAWVLESLFGETIEEGAWRMWSMSTMEGGFQIIQVIPSVHCCSFQRQVRICSNKV